MNFIPTISDFVTEANFIKLQNKFSTYDDRYANPEGEMTHENVSREDFEIIYKSYDSENIEKYETVFFYADFLNNTIGRIADIEIDNLKKRISKEFQYNNHERKSFINHQIATYRSYDSEIFNSIFLIDYVKVKLSVETTKILEFLYDDIILKDVYQTEDKMKIKMKRNDIQMLFFLLRQAKLVDHPYDADLGRCIDNFFLYFNSETNEFTEIKKSNKDLSDYKNYNKTTKNAIERLKAILTDEKFYKIEV